MSPEEEYNEAKIAWVEVLRLTVEGLLNWPKHRVDPWVKQFETELDSNPKSLLMCEMPTAYVAAAAIPEPLKERLAGPKLVRFMYAVEQAILEDEPCSVEGVSRMNWLAARSRVNGLLEEYGYQLDP